MQNPTKIDFRGLLTNCTRLDVPIYQRPYAWESEEINDFVHDLQRTISTGRAGNVLKHHFFGTVITIPRQTSDGTRHEIIDGQQRITTCTLACLVVIEGLAVLAEKSSDATFSSGSRSLAQQLRNTYLVTPIWDSERQETVVRRRLRLSRVDEPWLDAAISGAQPPTTRASHQRLNAARRKLYRELVRSTLKKETTDIEKREQLRLVMVALGEYSQIVHIPADTGEEAYQLFMTLNDRGRQLAAGDLLRTRSLELLRNFPPLQKEAADAWDGILDAPASSVDAFLRSYFASRFGQRLPKSRIFYRYREDLFPEDLKKRDKTEAKEFLGLLTSMKTESVWFRSLAKGVWPWESPSASPWQIDRLDRYVNRLGRQGEFPVLLSARSTDDEELFSDVLSTIERTAFRNSILGGHWGQFAEKAFSAAPAIREAGSNYDTDSFDRSMASHVWAKGEDRAFRANLESRLKYTLKRDELKHALTTVDDCWHVDPALKGSAMLAEADTSKVWVWEKLHVEHIYPQSPSEDSRDRDMDNRLHDLGNLTIWRDTVNAAAGNDAFDEKRKRYEKANEHMTRALADLEHWNVEDLETRQDDILNRLVDLYYIQDDVEPPVSVTEPPATYIVKSIRDSDGNLYNDQEGLVYGYLRSTPFGLQLKDGDTLVFFDRDDEGENLLYGIGRIGRILMDDPDRIAVLEAYEELEDQPGFLDGLGVEEPRANVQHAINPLSNEQLLHLMELAGTDLDLAVIGDWRERAENLLDTFPSS